MPTNTPTLRERIEELREHWGAWRIVTNDNRSTAIAIVEFVFSPELSSALVELEAYRRGANAERVKVLEGLLRRAKGFVADGNGKEADVLWDEITAALTPKATP